MNRSSIRCAFISPTLVIVALISAWNAPHSAWAVERVYNIVTNQSNVAISGSVTAASGTSPIQQQGPGSLTTNYSGTIRTDRGATSIQFLSGSAIDANVSGNWQPLGNGSAGSAPADYGGRVSFLFGLITANLAARDVVGDLTSGVLPIDGIGEFSLATTSLTLTNGGIAFRENLSGEFGAASLVGQSGTLSGVGTLTTGMQGGGTLETLTIPIDASFVVPIDATTTANFSLDGQLVATATIPAALPGDYNENGTVDAADYILWRNNVGSGTALPNDDTPGVGPDDYDRWRSNFSQTGGSGAATAHAVPEPVCAAFLLTAAAGLAVGRSPRQNRPHARRVFLRGVC